MKPKYKLFLSSTSDLEATRKALRAELPQYLDAFDYTLKGAEDVTVKEVLLKQLKEANVFVGLLGGKWGSACPADWSLPSQEPKYPVPERSISFVEWEFLTARSLRQSTLMFVQKIDEQKIDAQQKQFIGYLDAVVWPPRFETEPDLKVHFWRSYVEWRDRLQERTAEKELEVSEKSFPYAGVLAGIAFLMFPIALLCGVDSSRLLIIGGFSLAVMMLSFLLMMVQSGGLNVRRQQQR